MMRDDDEDLKLAPFGDQKALRDGACAFIFRKMEWLTKLLMLGQLAFPSTLSQKSLDTAHDVARLPAEKTDPYVCERLGLNNCWQPSEQSIGPPYSHNGVWPPRYKTCVIAASNDPLVDDAPTIIQAFSECSSESHIVFENTTYNIKSVMNTTGLRDVDIELRGTLLWDTNFQYWLDNSLPIGFQNQSSAWHLGGERIHFYGNGYGTFDGNGQAWYDFNQGVSNRPGRPHAILITDTKDSVVEGIRFVQSQMWTMTVARSEKVLLQDIYVNNTSLTGSSNVNTDGIDTVYANNITILRWTVDNGDDAVTMKQNSTNIYIANCTFYNGMGIAMGSIGQYPGQIEVIENVYAENIRFVKSGYVGRIKTWTGMTKGYPPNGGGGGIGYAKNVTFKDFVVEDVRRLWSLGQCVNFEGKTGDCNTSGFKISDMYWGDTTGTMSNPNVATLQCSETAPCSNINLFNNSMTSTQGGGPVTGYLCEAVESHSGFECTGPCNGDCPTE